MTIPLPSGAAGSKADGPATPDARSTSADRRLWAAGILIAGLAFALRLLHLMSLRDLPTFEGYVMDEAYHDRLAREAAEGAWLSGEPYFRAPLYPLVLGLVYRFFGTGGFAPRLLQGILGAASVLLIHRIALRVTRPSGAAAAALLAAVCWPLIHYDNELVSPVLEVFLILGAILVLLRTDEARRGRLPAFGGGVLIGLAAITRPNTLLFSPAAALWTGWPARGRGRSLGSAAAVLLGTMAVVAPVTARNWLIAGDPLLIAANGGVNFYIGNNPMADGTTAVVPGTRPSWQGGYDDSIGIAQAAAGRSLKPSEVSRFWYRRGIAFWTEHPLDAALLTLRKAVLFASGTEISNNKDLTFFRGLSPILSLPLPATWLLAPLGLAGWAAGWRAGGSRRRAMALPLLFAATYVPSVVAFFVTTRYRIPVLPVYAIGSGLLLSRLGESLRRGPRRPALLQVAVAGALLVLMNLNPFAYHDDPAQGHLVLGEAYERIGRLDRAIEEFGRASAREGLYQYEALRLKGEALAARGRLPEAWEALGRSVRLRPDNMEALSAWLSVAVRIGRYAETRAAALGLAPLGTSARADVSFTVGSMDQALGATREAEEGYRHGLSLRPDHLGARVNLALLLRGEGRLDASLHELVEAEARHPESAPVHLNLAKHYLFVGDRAAALHHLERARRLGAAIPADFQAALDAPDGRRDMMAADPPVDPPGGGVRDDAGGRHSP